jgi:prepilin signal peptidase PulO-like enzyme (type II secretory pathway)
MSSSEAMPVAVPASPSRRKLGDVAVVISGAVLVGAAFARGGLSADTLVDAFVIVVLVAISRIDIERRIIPNRIVLPAWGIVLVANLALHPAQWWEWLLASFGCALLFLFLVRVSNGGLGMGDMKLVAFLGAALGGDVVPALIIGTALAALVSIAIILRHGAEGRQRTIAFGPYLAAGAIAALLFL